MKLSEKYFNSIGVIPRDIPSFHFCDNEKDANECAKLVLLGKKRATASSLWSYEIFKENLPRVGDLVVVTDWNGDELCVIRIDNVVVVPFNEVTSDFAFLEGEGDQSLDYWKRVHWDYFKRELDGSIYEPQENMPVVCERFSLVFQC